MKRQVGLRGISLAVLALTLRGWAALVMLGVWGARVAIARATEASDLKMTKVCYHSVAIVISVRVEVCVYLWFGLVLASNSNPRFVATEASDLKTVMVFVVVSVAA